MKTVKPVKGNPLSLKSLTYCSMPGPLPWGNAWLSNFLRSGQSRVKYDSDGTGTRKIRIATTVS